MNVNANGHKEKEVVVVRSDEDLDEVARMAAGGTPTSGATRYVSLGEFTKDDFLNFSVAPSDAEARDTDKFASMDGPEGAALDNERGGDLLKDSSYVPDEDALRASREAQARARHASINGEHEDESAQTAGGSGGDGLMQRVAETVKPQGKTNRRIVMVALVLVALVAIFLFGSITRGKKKKGAEQGAPAEVDEQQQSVKKEDAMRVRSASGDTLRSTEEIGGGNMKSYEGNLTSSDPVTGAQGQPQQNPLLARSTSASLLATPIVATEPARAVAAPKRDEEGAGVGVAVSRRYSGMPDDGQGGGYAVKRPTEDEGRDQSSRSRSSAKREEENGAKPASNGLKLPAGTRIQMVLLEPLQTGIATTADARVLADVRDVQGNVLIPRGSSISVPFLAVHSNGRMMNDAAEEIDFKTPSGDSLLMTGSVKGPDGYVGIPGVVTKKGGGSTIGGAIKGIARGGARVAGRVIGQADPTGIGTDAVSETGIQSAVSGRYGNRGNAQREVVSVAAGIEFTFVVGK